MTSAATILVAEDEETDAILLCRAFKKAGLSGELRIVRDGEEAVTYLKGEAPYADRTANPMPELVLLDLKMPRMSGFDVLAWSGSHGFFERVPFVIFSSSSSEADRQRAEELGASEYRVKPNAFTELVRTVCDLHGRWVKPVGH